MRWLLFMVLATYLEVRKINSKTIYNCPKLLQVRNQYIITNNIENRNKTGKVKDVSRKDLVLRLEIKPNFLN